MMTPMFSLLAFSTLEKAGLFAIVGVFGLVVILFLIVYLFFYVIRKRQNANSHSQNTEFDNTSVISAHELNSLLANKPLTLTKPRDEKIHLHNTVKLKNNMRYDILVGAKTDRGIRRRADVNQDNVLALTGARFVNGTLEPFGVFIVADGMGGHQFGYEASARAIRVILDNLLQPLIDGQALGNAQIAEALRSSIEAANIDIYQRNKERNSDMGTTVTAAVVVPDIAFVANVGDSRTYLLPIDKKLYQITEDHSVVAGLVLAGVIAPEDIYTHPKRNQIYRSLGDSSEVDIDMFQVDIGVDDMLLLCSDGLWEMVRDWRLQNIMESHSSVNKVIDELVDEANDNGGVDNISAICVKLAKAHEPILRAGVHLIVYPEALNVQKYEA